MAIVENGTILGLSWQVESGRCVSCGRKEPVVVVAGNRDATVCEACSSLFGLVWKRVLGEVLPGFPEEFLSRVSSVSVLVARRKVVPGSEALGQVVHEPRQLPSAYEFLMVPDMTVDETFVLPTCPISPGMSIIEGASKALEHVNLQSWPVLLETFHVGYTPRGRLAAVVLARGYAQSAVPKEGYSNRPMGIWKSWPLLDHVGNMAGFWRFMETAWPLRLYRHCVPEDKRPEEISVNLREVGRRYVELMLASLGPADAGSGSDAEVDTSMLLAYRAVMTHDELAIAELVKADAESCRSRKRLPEIPEDGETADAGDGSPDGGMFDDGDKGDDEGGGDDGEDGEEDSDEEQPEPGFARTPRKG